MQFFTGSVGTAKPKTSREATRLLKKWVLEDPIPGDSLIRHHAFASDAYAQERLTLAQQARDALSAQKVQFSNQADSLRSEIQNLPSKVSTSLGVAKTAEAKLDAPKREYQSLSSQESILYSQYASLDSGRISHLGCVVLEMFGFGGPCGSFNEANFLSVKSRYEIAKSRADSA